MEVPLIVWMPGVAPRRTPALTTHVDVPVTILALAGVESPNGVTGRSLVPVLRGDTDEHRELIVSSWPLEYQRGRISIAVDSWPRRVARDRPLTVTGRGLLLLAGGPDDDLELSDLTTDPYELRNVALERPRDAEALLTDALHELLAAGTAEELLAPRRGALERFRATAGI